MVFIHKLETVIKGLIMAVDSVNVFEEAIEDREWRRNVVIYKKRATEVYASLHKVVC